VVCKAATIKAVIRIKAITRIRAFWKFVIFMLTNIATWSNFSFVCF
jgi:hypothetical protein